MNGRSVAETQQYETGEDAGEDAGVTAVALYDYQAGEATKKSRENVGAGTHEIHRMHLVASLKCFYSLIAFIMGTLFHLHSIR